MTVEHPERADLKAVLCAEVDYENNLPELKHLYLESRAVDGWRRTRQIKKELFGKYMKRFGFDELEATLLLEEAAEEEVES